MKKFLVSLLAVAVVLSMAGVVLAVDTGHAGHTDPTTPGVKTPTSEDVTVISTDVLKDAPVGVELVVADMESDPEKLATELANLPGFTSNDIFIDDDNKVAEGQRVTPVTKLPLSVDVASVDDPLVLGLSMDWNASYQAFLRAHTSGKVSVDKKTYTVSKDNWRGKPVVSLAESGDLVKLSIYSPDLFFSSNDVVIAKVEAPASSGSSSSGCNVGFAPMALLLGLPLFFLKK
ncbi:hypothetical protein Dpep_0773 [Dethiosulfovibrio peptidovorans DSM 11002]|uniref:Uncharacterized protein n=1 Tax=Dethiosulfovibrio peptidovorans DSM 11002 TaxID=469381 RepID=D2Z5Q2_9BACT|nr:Synerg-CTERM sorting domain-containing protein [Dethiosulfovibrio peptidovorans]EFC90799.1 hypothetical protein Dpep_0773 [Dethiosulfovibrio peptidovorans DSM 11002]